MYISVQKGVEKILASLLSFFQSVMLHLHVDLLQAFFRLIHWLPSIGSGYQSRAIIPTGSYII